MDWTQVFSIFLVIAAILGTVIPLHIQTLNTIKSIQSEMKDFHGRLERQDAEFKAYIMYEGKKP